MPVPAPILMVCAGNLCRSPFAEGLMRNRLQQADIEDECFSRGLIAMPGLKAPDTAVRVAGEFGVDLSTHVSQPSGGASIPGSVGQDEVVFMAVYNEISGHIEAWLRRFGVA